MIIFTILEINISFGVQIELDIVDLELADLFFPNTYDVMCWMDFCGISIGNKKYL